jgi:hypothetical protein
MNVRWQNVFLVQKKSRRLAGLFPIWRPTLPVSLFEPEAGGPVVVLGAMLPIVERGQSMDSTLA